MEKGKAGCINSVIVRRSLLAMGGGVVGDLSDFVAATYCGIRFIQLPSTLLAIVDSVIGGKVAMNLAVGKKWSVPSISPELSWLTQIFLAT